MTQLSLTFVGPLGPSNVGGVDNFKVEATITNTGNETVKLLDDPRTLASTLPVDKFTIVHANGGNPSFMGMFVKFSPEIAAKEGEYSVLAPGDSLKVVHNCTSSNQFFFAHRSLTNGITVFEAYNFTDSGVGSYNLVPDSGFYFVDEKDEVGVIHADIAKSYTAQVDGPTLAVARADEPASEGLTKRASYVGCPNPRRLILRRAAASAEIYARNAKSYLTIRRGSTPRFTTWFGRFTPAHRATVLDHFNRIDANTFSQFTYDCTCTRPSTYAFVFANTSVVLPTFHFESR